MILYRYKGEREWRTVETRYKTTIGFQQLMRDIADDKVEVLFLDLEMSRKDLDARFKERIGK